MDTINTITRSIYPIFSTTKTNPITAYAMNNNETLITIALKSLDVFTIDLSKSKEITKKGEKLKTFFESEIDAGYPIGSEGDEEIRSIGLIPYSDLIIFSPSRFEIFKAHRRTGSIILRKRSFLDSIRYIVHPVPTNRPERDPHNPKNPKNPKLNQRFAELFSRPYFVATGHQTGDNVLTDWTNLNVVKYWNYKQISRKVHNNDYEGSYIIRSICYFGGNQNAQLYPFLASNVITELTFFKSDFGTIRGSIPLNSPSYDGFLTWINATNYVYISQKDMVGEAAYNFGSYFLNLGPYSIKTPHFIKEKVKYDETRYILPTLLAYNSDITVNFNFQDGLYQDLDHFYLFVHAGARSIIIEVAPFNWDICNSQFLEKSEKQYRMFTGKVVKCREESKCQLGYQYNTDGKHNDKDFDWEKTFFTCLRYQCPAGEIIHTRMGGFSADTLKRLSHTKTLDGSQGKVACAKKYKIDPNVETEANDNGCHAEFNLDDNGLCRDCKLAKFHFTNIKHFPYFSTSDCVFFNYEDHISWDGFTYAILNYTKDKLWKKFGYKKGKVYQSQKHGFYSKMFNVGEKGKEVKILTGTLAIPIETKTTKFPKLCYRFITNKDQFQGYDLFVREGYYLEQIAEDVTDQVKKSQFELYGKETSLNTYYCMKDCPEGYYYDFDSISCRRCAFGCSECKKYDHCDRCVPGFQLYKKPGHPHSHPVDKKLINHCHIGCQPGFYLKGFDGMSRVCG